MRTASLRVVVAGALVGLVAACQAAPPAEPEVAGALNAYISDFQQAKLALDQAHAVEAEEATAACMKEQGFDYVPNPQGAWVSTQVTTPPITPEWVAEHGYGIVDGSSQTTVGTTDSFPDPNADAVAAMSAAERNAWDAALHGDPGEERGGCALTVDPFAPLEDPQFQHFQEAQAAIVERAADEPEVADALRQWVDCMADAGYPGYTEPFEPNRAAWDAADKAGVLPDSGVTVTAERRAELLADEIALATADLGCDTSSGYADTFDETVERLQVAFVDENRAELDAWRAGWDTPAPTPQR